jgi:Ni,Fe-hydrogenase I small subunit
VSLNDSDIHHTHHTKAAVGAVAALATGDPATFCSVAALRPGPAGVMLTPGSALGVEGACALATRTVQR